MPYRRLGTVSCCVIEAPHATWSCACVVARFFGGIGAPVHPSVRSQGAVCSVYLELLGDEARGQALCLPLESPGNSASLLCCMTPVGAATTTPCRAPTGVRQRQSEGPINLHDAPMLEVKAHRPRCPLLLAITAQPARQVTRRRTILAGEHLYRFHGVARQEATAPL